METVLDINCFDKTIANIPSTNFLCLVTDDTRTCDNNIDQLISRLNSACYAITAVQTMSSEEALRMLYFPCIHSVISYSIMFGGNNPNSIKIFTMQK